MAPRPEGPANTAHLERALAAGAERDVIGRLRHDGEMRLMLRPQGLGDLEVRVAVRDGGVHASVATTNDDARQLLASQRADLQTALGRYNLRLDSFSVGVGGGRGDGTAAFERDARATLAGGRQQGPAAPAPSGRLHAAPASLDPIHGARLSVRV
jgi:hypothetical protein